MTKGQGDLARVNSIEPDDSWPAVVEIRLGWKRGAVLVFSSLTVTADQFFGRAGYGAPIQGEWVIQQIDRMRKAGGAEAEETLMTESAPMTSRNELLASIQNNLIDWLERPNYAADVAAETILADLERKGVSTAAQKGQDALIECCAKAVVFCGECDCPRLSIEAIRALSASPQPADAQQELSSPDFEEKLKDADYARQSARAWRRHALAELKRRQEAEEALRASPQQGQVNLPFERLPQHAGDPGVGPVPNVVPLTNPPAPLRAMMEVAKCSRCGSIGDWTCAGCGTSLSSDRGK